MEESKYINKGNLKFVQASIIPKNGEVETYGLLSLQREKKYSSFINKGMRKGELL